MQQVDSAAASCELQRRLQSSPGDPALWVDLDIAYRKRLYGYIRSIGGARFAEDIVQITMLVFFRAVCTRPLTGPFEGLLFTIARNETYDYLRKESKAAEPADPSAHHNVVITSISGHEDLVVIRADIDAFLLYYRARGNLCADDADRRALAFRLRFLYQMAPADIASRMQLPLTTITNWLHRTREAFLVWYGQKR